MNSEVQALALQVNKLQAALEASRQMRQRLTMEVETLLSETIMLRVEIERLKGESAAIKPMSQGIVIPPPPAAPD